MVRQLFCTQKICTSDPPVVTETYYYPNKSRARHHWSLKIGSKVKYLNYKACSHCLLVLYTIYTFSRKQLFLNWQKLSLRENTTGDKIYKVYL